MLQNQVILVTNQQPQATFYMDSNQLILNSHQIQHKTADHSPVSAINFLVTETVLLLGSGTI